jgi:hypothetical protein
VGVGTLTLAVLLVICVSVFEMLLAMLDAAPEPHPAVRTARTHTDATFTRNDRPVALILIVDNFLG